jgi:hypothetical protein
MRDKNEPDQAANNKDYRGGNEYLLQYVHVFSSPELFARQWECAAYRLFNSPVLAMESIALP